MNICLECASIETKFHRFHEIYLCANCKELSKYKLLTKTIVKNEWFLTDKDIKDIHYFETANTMFKRAAPICLYIQPEIESIFCSKFNCSNDLIEQKKHEIKIEKDNKREKREAKKNIKVYSKKELLTNELTKFGLEFRDDSSLCKQYINGTLHGWTIPQIVKRMCQMKFLFEYCDMDEAFEKAKDNFREYGERYDKEELFNEAERIALQKTRGYPDKFPWLL